MIKIFYGGMSMKTGFEKKIIAGILTLAFVLPCVGNVDSLAAGVFENITFNDFAS